MAKLYRIAINQDGSKVGFAYRNYTEFKDAVMDMLDSVEGFGDGNTEIKLSTREENEKE